MSSITSKEYLRSLITKGFKGEKIDAQESATLEKEFTNFTANDWRNFKIAGREVIKEEISKHVENDNSVPANLKNESKNFALALINLLSSLASEELIMESIRLEKEKAPKEQRIKNLSPLLVSSLEKIVARQPVKKVKDYHAAEAGLSKKCQKIKGMIIRQGLGAAFGGGNTIKQNKEILTQLFSILKSLRPEEIKVAKEKGKEWINSSLPIEIKSQPESAALIQAFIKFLDAVLDEELVSEGSQLLIEILEIAIEEINLEGLMKLKNPMEGTAYGASFGPQIDRVLASRGDLKSRGRSLLVNWTNHLNLLAGEKEINQSRLTLSEEQAINQRLEEARKLNSSDNSSTKTGSGLSGLSPNFLLGDGLKGLNFNLSTLDKKMSTVQSSPKWYKNPWVIGFLVVGGILVGSLITWLLLRKKERKEWEN